MKCLEKRLDENNKMVLRSGLYKILEESALK